MSSNAALAEGGKKENIQVVPQSSDWGPESVEELPQCRLIFTLRAGLPSSSPVSV